MAATTGTDKKPFIDHVRELQIRLTVCFVAILAGAGLGYAYHEELLALVQKPLGQTLYYTSPTGGFSSLFKLCIAAGIVVATPVILYNVFRFFEPLLTVRKKRTIVKYTVASVLLAYTGVVFAYLISLPAALHFLSKFGGEGVQSLITIDSYYNFALSYIISFAVVFQLPLYVLFFNRIKPLTPGGMMGAQRYIIVGSFIGAAILTPTPDPFNQLLMAAPAIVLYQVGIILVWRVNRKARKKARKQAMQYATQTAQPATTPDITPATATPLASNVPVPVASNQPRAIDGVFRGVTSAALQPTKQVRRIRIAAQASPEQSSPPEQASRMTPAIQAAAAPVRPQAAQSTMSMSRRDAALEQLFAQNTSKKRYPFIPEPAAADNQRSVSIPHFIIDTVIA